MSKELWRPVPGCVGLYEISNHGTLRSVERFAKTQTGKLKFLPSKIRKPFLSHGYKCNVIRFNDGTERLVKYHRLVALQFVSGWFEGAIINHKDGDKSNNHFSNLEWCDHSHNIRHAYDNNLRGKAKIDRTNFVLNKPLVNVNTGEIYPSIKIASEVLGIKKTTLTRKISLNQITHIKRLA